MAEHASRHRQPILTSLGLAVIDEIRFGNGEVVKDHLGGSGTFCTVGARLFTSHDPASIAWRVHAGSDFPSAIEQLIAQWKIDFHVQKRLDRLSTRGLLIYADTTFGPKTFQYTTPVLSVTPADLKSTELLGAKSFHILCEPDKLQDQVATLLELRLPLSLSRPLILWEPSPPACVAKNLAYCLAAIKAVDVFSPNHLELLSLFDMQAGPFSKSRIEELGRHCLDSGVGPNGKGIVVVRAGEYGCVLMSRDADPIWIPPYYRSSEKSNGQTKIVDSTGAGNTFLGGFAVGYQETEDWLEACYFGTVAASFMLEQIGTPVFEIRSGTEYWNGENPRARLDAFRKSCKG